MTDSDLWSKIRKARLGRVVLVYAGASWAVLEATDFFINRFGLPESFLPAALVLLLIGFGVMLVTAVAQVAAPRLLGLFNWRNALIGGAFAFGLWGAGATAWLILRADAVAGADDMRSVAVLPFANMSADPENEYFSDGITDDIITHLSTIGDLKVISRTSVMRYKETDKSLREIGQELGVAAILEGGVRRSGDRVRINAQLIDAQTDHHLWAQIYDRELTDVFAIQTDVAQHIAEALKATLTPEERKRIERRPTDNLEAYESYLRGNAYYNRAEFDYALLVPAESSYARAVELDPGLAVAWAELSQVHSTNFWYFVDRTPERLERARQAFERAFELEPDLPQAHAAAGYYYYYGRRDYEKALRSFEAALASEPNHAEAWNGAAWVYRRSGNWERAISNLQRAVELDPRAGRKLLSLGETLYYTGQFAEAERHFKRALVLDPEDEQALRLLAWLQISGHGDVDSARALVGTAMDVASAPLPGADDLQPHWLVRVIGHPTWMERLTLAAFDGDTLEYLLTVGEIARRHGETARAREADTALLEMLDRSIAADPDESRYRSLRGLALAGLGRAEEAIREGRRAVELLPVGRDALWGRAYVDNLALTFLRAGEPDSAVAQLDRTLALAGPITPAWLRVDPAWDALRDHPGFQKLVAR